MRGRDDDLRVMIPPDIIAHAGRDVFTLATTLHRSLGVEVLFLGGGGSRDEATSTKCTQDYQRGTNVKNDKNTLAMNLLIGLKLGVTRV